MILYAATGNDHKRKELQEILKPHTIRIPKDDGIAFDPVEDGDSFVSNSIIKAKTLWDVIHQPVLADDSGICVDILDGRPGIFSARYGGKGVTPSAETEKLPSQERNRLLLEEAWEAARIKAGTDDPKALEPYLTCRFVCCMVLYLGPDRFYTTQETLEGRLITPDMTSRGNGGFGYDPIMYIPERGKTVAELSDDEKNAISHRGKATEAIARHLTVL